ncbi:MAG: BACON domain-containing protein, partial [Bacteroidales bacterium]|nr:BACON domain-containing protein [Bacteroidales bacterium]
MKTNIFRYAISLAAVFAAVISCDKKQPEEEQKGPEKVDPIFPSSVVNETVKAGQSVDLKFEPNMEWKVEISGEGKGNIFWIDDAGMKATSVSSKETGPQVVTIVFSENEEFDKNRVCEVTLSMGGESKKIATYTRPSLSRTFEVYVGVPGEFGFSKDAGAYVYTGTVATEASLSTFTGDVSYGLPIK